MITAAALAVGAAPQRPPAEAVAVLDPFATPAYAVTEIHDSGRATFCLIEADRWRPRLPDSARLEPATRQSTRQPARQPAHRLATIRTSMMDSGARPLDPAQWRLTATVLSDRIALCAAKRFTGAVISVGDQAPAELVRMLRAQANRWGLLVVLVHARAPEVTAGPGAEAAAGSADRRTTTGS